MRTETVEHLATLRAEIEQALRRAVPDSEVAPVLTGMLQYHLRWCDSELRPARCGGGKRLRPVLCLLAAEAVGGDRSAALPAATAIEVLHNSILIHDDVQARDQERHGQPTLWRLWGDALAIGAGDGALALAEQALLSCAPRVGPLMAVRAAEALNSTYLRLTEGQHLGIAFVGRADVTVADYLTMVRGKTAALIGCSLELGALLGGATPALARGYGAVGEALGIALQAQDDLLGIWGDRATAGKPAADLARRKLTLPVLFALAQAAEGARNELLGFYRGSDPDEAAVVRARTLIEEADGRQATVALAWRYHDKALSLLGLLGAVEPAGGYLRELAASLLASKS